MAKINIRMSGAGQALFATAAPTVEVSITLDEALAPKDFRKALCALTVSADTLVKSVPWTNGDEDEEPVLPTMITVPDDQVQTIAGLNSGTDHPGGLLIIPASAVRLNPDEPAPDLDPEQHFGNEPDWGFEEPDEPVQAGSVQRSEES